MDEGIQAWARLAVHRLFERATLAIADELRWEAVRYELLARKFPL